VPSPTEPATLVCCLTGTSADRTGLLRTLAAAIRPGDHAFAIEGSCGPAAPVPAEVVPAGIDILRAPAIYIGVAYDIVALRSPHEQLIFLGAGCTIAPDDVERIRFTLSSVRAGVVTLSPYRDATTVALGARAILGAHKRVVTELGGMASSTFKARGMGLGLIGSSDLFDAFANEVRRSGWRVENLEQTTNPLPTRHHPAAAVTERAHRLDDKDPSVPPSRRLPADLLAAAHPDAGVTVDWFAALLPEEQKKALSSLIGREAEPSSRTTSEGWDALLFAGLLWSSGQKPYAAHVLETADLSLFTQPAQVANIWRILADSGRPLPAILRKLRHAELALAAALLELPPDQANAALGEWWELEPDSELVRRAVNLLLPVLEPSAQAAWESRLRCPDRTVADPLAS